MGGLVCLNLSFSRTLGMIYEKDTGVRLALRYFFWSEIGNTTDVEKGNELECRNFPVAIPLIAEVCEPQLTPPNDSQLERNVIVGLQMPVASWRPGVGQFYCASEVPIRGNHTW